MRVHVLVAALAAAGGCSRSLVCGPGTVEQGGACVVAPSDAGAVTDGQPASDAAAAADAGVADDARVAGDAAAGTEAGTACPPALVPPSDPGLIECGATPCSADAGTVCFLGISPTESPRCVTRDQLPSGAPLIHECDEAADCEGGQRCCLQFVYRGTRQDISTTCDGQCAYGQGTQACRTDEECGSGGQCSGYSVGGGTLIVATCRAPAGCL